MGTEPTPPSTPPSSEVSSALTSRLTPKLLEDAATRISHLAVVIAVLFVGVGVFHHFAQPLMADRLREPIVRLATLFTVLAGIGVFALRRYDVVSSRAVLGLGMTFAVMLAFCIALIETSVPIDPTRPVVGISAIGPWIVAVGAFIPNRPVWTLVSGLAMASMFPTAYAINAARLGFDAVPIGMRLVWPLLNYLMVPVAVLINRRTYGTAIQAQAALELGSYRLEAPIGQGGMGEIWKASHQMLARAAAIKLVKPDALAGGRQADVSVKRFRREANVIANLKSPHTVYLYDFGVSEDGRFYYVMELLDGISLQALVTTFGPQPAARVGAVLQQICQSLEEAHEQGLVHRDLKPSNVMLCKLGLTHDFVKVLDFGLTKYVGQQNVTQLTMEGMATGTPGYMAPEIAMSSTGIDARADIYALGCVAYFLLTGTQVFPDDNPMSMALKHVQVAPDPPSSRSELPISPAMEDVVMRCLAKKPGDRPASAREVSTLLQACGIPDWTEADADGWWQRHLPPTSSLRSFAQTVSVPLPVVRKA
jgi:serine/threonine-protein kinase